MFNSKKIGVVIPCLNEESLITETLNAVPKFVDIIYVINDGSTDNTAGVVGNYIKKDKRVILLNNKVNMGNGYSAVRGLKQGINEGMDVMCIVAGDNQCRQEYLELMVYEVITNNIDYAKASRFFDRRELKSMPAFRKFGNIFMSLINKFATGYYSVSDPLNSFSAISSSSLREADLDSIGHRYEFENDFLFQMYLVNGKVKEIAVPAKYENERSSIKLLNYIFRTTKALIKIFFKRIYYKYFLFSLHPIIIFVGVGSILFIFGIIWGFLIINESAQGRVSTTATVMLSVLPLILGFQLLLQSIVMDIQNEPK